MITLQQVQKAMRMLDNPREYLNCEAVEKQLAHALELYQDRQEYDGTIETAIECLSRACYEISKEGA